MKFFGIALVLTTVLAVSSVGLGQHDSSQIKNFQRFVGNSGLAYTSSFLYTTDDNGESWTEINLQKFRSQEITQVYFSSRADGWVLLADSGNSTLEIRQTSDGGNSWTATQISIDSNTLQDADLENALLILITASAEWNLFIPLPTSSNFRGSLVFTSDDNWKTWQLRSRDIRFSTPEGEGNAKISSGGWTLRQGGTCFGIKTECVQETRLYRADI